jgi:hypothetical protein
MIANYTISGAGVSTRQRHKLPSLRDVHVQASRPGRRWKRQLALLQCINVRGRNTGDRRFEDPPDRQFVSEAGRGHPSGPRGADVCRGLAGTSDPTCEDVYVSSALQPRLDRLVSLPDIPLACNRAPVL